MNVAVGHLSPRLIRADSRTRAEGTPSWRNATDSRRQVLSIGTREQKSIGELTDKAIERVKSMAEGIA